MRGALRGMSYAQGVQLVSAKDDKQGGGGFFGGGLKSLTDRLSGGLKNLTGPDPTKQQIQALKYVRDMLEPNKLGGADRTFNFADRQAVVAALMRDTCGLRQEIQAQLNAEGKRGQARLVGKALGGGRGPLKRMARNKVYNEAPGQIHGQLTDGLVEGGIDPATGELADNVPRQLTFDELREFERNAAILQKMQEEVAQRLGLNVAFPGGLSQASIEHTLDRKLGIPPGAKITPRAKN